MMSKNNNILFCKPANSELIHQLDAEEFVADNEICCPPFDECLWSSHPRVFLKLDKQGQVKCPYCNTEYELGKDKDIEN